MSTEKKTGKQKEKNLSIEGSFERLSEILSDMEAEDCPLEKSFGLYEEGMRLIASAGAQIDQVEKKLRILNGEEADPKTEAAEQEGAETGAADSAADTDRSKGRGKQA